MKPLDQFVNNYYGESVPNNHGGFVGECVSLAARWAQEGQAVPDGDRALYCAYTGGARDLYESYGKTGMYIQELYDKTDSPQDGDLVVWGANMGKYGDVAVYIGSGQVFGQLGTPVFIPAAARHMTPQPLGYLRRKGTGVNNYPDEGNLINYYNTQNYPGHPPNKNDIAYWCNGTGNPYWGNPKDVWWHLGNEVANYAKSHVQNPTKPVPDAVVGVDISTGLIVVKGDK